jgi:hypothetical protein
LRGGGADDDGGTSLDARAKNRCHGWGYGSGRAPRFEAGEHIRVNLDGDAGESQEVTSFG